jgi:RNA polymerase sigma-70 factor (ECF subfamily)
MSGRRTAPPPPSDVRRQAAPPYPRPMDDGRLVGVPHRRLSDEALVERAGRADALALAELYARHRAVAHGVAWRILLDAELAEDAVQEAFLHAWRSAARFSPQRGPARTWILTLVHHRAVDIVRSRRVRPAEASFEHVAEQSDAAIEAAFDAIGDRDPVRQALRSLPPRFRMPLALAYYADLTQQECAEVLSAPLGTVKSRTCRGLSRMRQQLAAGTARTQDAEQRVSAERSRR